VRALLLRLARLPSTRQGRAAFAVIAGVGLLLRAPTEGRSIGVAFVLIGAISLLHGWAIATDWGGTWSDFRREEKRRVERRRNLPLGRSRAGSAAVELTRDDSESSRAMKVMGAVVAAPLLITFGVLITLGVLELS
jgi:hypothetical protein